MTQLSKQTQLLSYPTLVRAIAGGCASAVAMSVFYPLDIIRTRQQLEEKKELFLHKVKKVYNDEGMIEFYRGLLPVIQSLFCSNFVYFYSFHGLKEITNSHKSPLKDLVLGMIAGCINVLSTTPLWVVNTRIKMQGRNTLLKQFPKQISEYDSLIGGLLHIAKYEGISALWSGSLSSLILVINPAIQFMVYETIKRNVKSEMSALKVFCTGAVAKAVATIITYPLQLVQTKQRHNGGTTNLAGIISMLYSLTTKDGINGLYKGIETKLTQTVLTAALMFLCYEKIVSYVFSVLLGQKKLGKIKI